MADRQKHEITDIRVEGEREDEDDAHYRVECGRFDDHDCGDLVSTHVFSLEDISHLLLEGKQTARDEEGVNDGQSDLDAKIYELGVDVIKDGTARFGKDKNRHG